MKLSDHFGSDEFQCPCKACVGIAPIVDPKLILNLEKLRAILNAQVKPGEKEHALTVNSGCRCPDYNRDKHGAEASQHIYNPVTGQPCRGADVWCTTRPTREVYQAALSIPEFKGIGLAPPRAAIPPDPSHGKPGRPALPGYVHVDVRPDSLRSQWGYDDAGSVVALSVVLPRDWTV